jgi:hypothetical protein
MPRILWLPETGLNGSRVTSLSTGMKIGSTVLVAVATNMKKKDTIPHR